MLTIGRIEDIYIKIPTTVGKFRYLKEVAKIDTGAYGSTVHFKKATKFDGYIELVLDDNKILYLPDNTYTYKEIKSSIGKRETRLTTKLSIKIGNRKFKTVFTFTNRSEMRNKVLLGRKFLKNRFIVDVSKIKLLG